MKRRETKKSIRKEERHLAETALAYLKFQSGSAHEDSTLFLCSALTYLLFWYLQLDSTWNYKERWLDGISYPEIEVLLPNLLEIRGRMVWGLRNDVGGEQWDEPFEARIQTSQAEGRLVSYQLSFGEGKNKHLFYK